MCVCVCLYVCVGPLTTAPPPPSALCVSMCHSDSHHCSRSVSASPLNAGSLHHPHQNAERWRLSSASTPDITQRQRRRNSTPVGRHAERSPRDHGHTRSTSGRRVKANQTVTDPSKLNIKTECEGELQTVFPV